MAQRYVRGTSALKTQPDESYYPAAQLPAFDLVEGSATAVQTPAFLSTLAFVLSRALIVALAFFVLNAVRVSLCSSTVDVLSSNVSLRKDIRAAGILNDDLRAQTSVLSSTERIVRIAEANMGMIAADNPESLQLNLEDQSGPARQADGQSAKDSPTFAQHHDSSAYQG